jgi:hypothetical protein
VAGLQNLEGILKWAPAADAPLAGIDLLQQSEHSYDLFEQWAVVCSSHRNRAG